MDTQFWQLVRIAHLGITFAALVISAIGLVVMTQWPAIRGRGLIIGSFALSAVAHLGVLLLGALQFVSSFGGMNGMAFSRLLQVGYLLMNVATPAGGLLLLVGLVTIGRELTVLLEQFEYLQSSHQPPPLR